MQRAKVLCGGTSFGNPAINGGINEISQHKADFSPYFAKALYLFKNVIENYLIRPLKSSYVLENNIFYLIDFASEEYLFTGNSYRNL